MVINEKAHREWIADLMDTRDRLTTKYSAHWYHLNERIEQLRNDLQYCDLR